MKNVNLFTFNRSEAQKNTLCASVNISNASPRDDREITETLPRPYRWAKLAATLTLLLTLGVGQMWAGAGFYETYFAYSYNGTTGSKTCTSSGTETTDLGTLTADFNITQLCLKYWKDGSGNMCGGLVEYYISSDQEYQPSWTWTAKGGNNHELNWTGTWTVAQYNTGASGAYTFWYRFKTWGSTNSSSGCSNNFYIPTDGSSKNKFTYKIAPPAVSDFEVSTTGSNILSGSGTSADPYIIAYNGSLVLSLSGSKGRKDANSSLQYYTSSSWNSTTSRTISSITSTTRTSVTVKMRCYNSTASLSGAESSKEIFYKSEESYNVTAAKTPSAGGSVTPTSATKMGTTSGGNITASANTGYTFTSWAITSGSGYFGESGTATTSTTANTKFRPSAATTVTATFTPKTYTITLKKNGADCASDGSATATYNSGSVTSATYPTYTDYRCDGYYTKASGGDLILNTNGTFVASTSYTDASGNWTNDADLTLYAHWTYDVTNYTVNYGVGTSYTSLGGLTAYNNSTFAALGASPQSVRSGHSVTFTASPNTGYVVEGWYTNAACTSGMHDGGSTTYTTSITGTTDVYVKYVEKTWSVAFAAGTGGSVTTPAATPQTVGQLTGISIAATPGTGYTFNRWTITSGSGSFTSAETTNSNKFKPTAASTVTASFTETMRTITITNGTAANTTAGVVSKGTATANVPADGKKFTGWTLGTGVTLAAGSALTDRTIQFTATQNSTVTANYADRAQVKVYFAKPTKLGWGTLYAYAWKDGGTANADYPGVALSTTETINCITYYVYQYYTEGDGIGGAETGSSTWDKVIFGCGFDDKKTANLTLSNGHYYFKASAGSGESSAITSAWYIEGTMNSWSRNDNPITHDCANNKGTVAINLTNGTTYEFKVYDKVNEQEWSNSTAHGSTPISGTMASATTLYSNDPNVMKITANVTGSYTFEISATNEANPKVKVTFPVSYTLNYSVGSVKGNNGNISTSPSTSSGSKVVSGTNVTLTASAAKSGYTWKGWYTNAAGTEGKIADTNRAITVAMNADKTLYACYTETMHTVTVAAGAGGSRSPSSVSAGIDTKSGEASATANIGYVFTGWTLPFGTSAADGYTSASNPIMINATADSKTITANFAAATAFIEGRFHVTNDSRNGTWTNTFSGGDWDENSTRIKFTWDGTNSRFYLHTYATPQELTTQISSHDPEFYIKTSSSSSSLENVTSYWSSFAQEITTVGSANKKALVHSGGLVNSNLKFNSSDESGYVILYFDQAGIWYELEQTLTYDGNGNTGGSTPSGGGYKDKGSAITAATNTYTRTNYRFTGWNTQADGKGTAYADGASVTMNSNITLYAQWEPIPYTVTVNNGDHGTVTPHGSVVTNNVDGVSISASSVPGWVFASWSVTGSASVNDVYANPATLKATGAGGTVTANYIEANVIYFKDKLGWGDAYAYLFSADPWSDTNGVQPTKNLLVSGRMTAVVGEENVYKFEFNKSYSPTHIAFSKDNKISESYFNNTEGVCRGDYSTSYPMFVPSTTSNETKQGTKYYNDGDWFAYSTDKGYYICYNSTDYPLVFTSPGSLTASLATPINLPADYTAYTISVKKVRATTTTYGSSTTLDHAAYLAEPKTQAALVTSPATVTVTTLAKGNHNFTLTFTNTVAPQLALTTVPAAYQVTFGVGNGGSSTTAKRGADPGIDVTSGDYVAPGTRLTFNQTPSSGCEFVKWNTMRNGTGIDLGNSPILVTTMPSEPLTVYPLYSGHLETTWGLAGSFNNWSSEPMHQESVGSIGVVYKSVNLEAGKEYNFKIVDKATSPTDYWYGNTGTMTQAHCTDWEFTVGGGDEKNCKIVTTIAGEYNFIWNTSTHRLSVRYPDNAKQATMYDSPVRDANGDVMIQAYYWMDNGSGGIYDAFGDARWAALANEADTLGKYFNMVWLPPSQVTADRIGFLPSNYSQQGNDNNANLLWGTGAQLRTLIDRLHDAGAKVIADIVLNHSSAAPYADENNTSGNWCDWSTFNFGRYGSYEPDWKWVTKQDEMFAESKPSGAHIYRGTTGDCGAHYTDATEREDDEWDHSVGTSGSGSWSYSEYNCTYSRDWAHKKIEVREMSRAYLTWMRDSIGYDGWRYDFAKGFHGSHLYDYNRASGPYFSVAEVFDGSIDKQIGVLKDAGYSTYMFDFPGKFNIYNSAIREYKLQNLKNNGNTLIYSSANKKFAVTFIDNHDSFREEGKSLHYNPNTIDDRQAHQALAYLLSMPGVPCVFFPYWNNYKEICKKLIYARKAAGVNSESVVEADWAGSGVERDNYYTARIKGSKGYLFLKLGYDCVPTDPPYGSSTAPDGKTYVMAWGNSNAAVWYTTSDTEPLKYRLLVTCKDETFYSNEVTHPGDTLSYYATPDATYQWQKYELFEWHNVGATTPDAVSANNVYIATFDSVNVAVADVQPYVGDYYIRTDGASGGWNDYMASNKNNKFTYFSNVSVATGDPYHYYWVENIAKNSTANVKGQVANRFNKTITNELDADSYTSATCCVTGDSYGINIRFSYEPTTNKLGRTMILGSTEADFLNMIGSNIYLDADCKYVLDEAYYAADPSKSKLGDISDWVYEKSVYVKISAETPTSNVILKSMFKIDPSAAKQIQYMLGYQKDFYGNDTDDPLPFPVIASGTTYGTYRIRVIYDYKTNRLTGAWEPVDQTISSDQTIDADVLFIRYENNNAAQITMASNSDSIKGLQHVLFVLEMHRDTLKNQENHYWFSLPFDCQICNIFGLEGYMEKWGIQEYDGETRARNGWYLGDGVETFWRWMSPNETLKAGVGYVVHVDKSVIDWKSIDIDKEVCDKSGSGGTDTCYITKVPSFIKRLYFPSDSTGFKMSKTGTNQWITYEDWTCKKKNRKAQDSNWRLISAANFNNTTINGHSRLDNDSVLNKAPDFIYKFDGTKDAGNRYTAVDAKSGFIYKSFNCYMAQFSGTINWGQFTQATPQNIAARRYTASDKIERANMYLEMVDDNNVQQDFTYIYLRENATYGFDRNKDLTKIIYAKSNQVYSVNYSDVDTVPYVANVLPTESQIVRLTVNVNRAGTYTFRMPNGTDGAGVVLVDSELGKRTDLDMWSYTVELPKGNYSERFYIEIDVRKTPTVIDITNPDDVDENGEVIQTVKFMRDGLLYLRRGDKLYDAQGRKVN